MDILKDQEETNFSLNISKILLLIFSFCLALLFGYLPLMVKIKKRVIRYLSFINAFSGGVFLGVGLFILLPESKDISTEYFEDLEKKEGESLLYDLPYSYFFSFLSYSCLLLLEKVCFNTSMIIPLDLNEESGRDSHIEPFEKLDEDEEEEIIKNVVSTKGKFASFLQIRNIRTSNVNDANKPVDKNLLRSSVILSKTFKYKNDDIEEDNPDMDFFVNPNKVDGNNKGLKSEHAHKHDHDHDHDDHDHDHNHDHDHHGHSHGKKEFSSLTPYLLLFALCLDGFFEGLALGSQSSFTKLVFTGLCLLVNKCIVACNLGISFKIAVPDIRVFIRFVLLFSLFTPFGIMLAFILYTYNPLIKAAFLALASGSFIYVSSSVIIIEEFTVTKYKYTKFLLFLLGGIGTALVIYLTDNK